MAETQTESPDVLRAAAAAVGEAQQQIVQLQRQQRELQLLVRQIENDLLQAAARKDERAERVRVVQANPNAFSQSDVYEAYATLAEADKRHHVMQTQLDTLRQREQWLASQREQTERSLQLLGKLTEALAAHVAAQPGAPAPDSSPAQASAPADLARCTVNVREEQNRWLSQHLQDGPIQALSNLVLQAEVSQRLLDRDVQRARSELQSLKTAAARALRETRFFVFELRPLALEETGLRSTLRRYVAEVSTRSGVAVRLSLPGQDVRLPAPIEIGLFRIAQESLRAALLATPAEVEMALALAPERASLAVTHGNPCPAAEGAAAILETLATYARALGASLNVEGPDERGFRVRLEVECGASS